MTQESSKMQIQANSVEAVAKAENARSPREQFALIVSILFVAGVIIAGVVMSVQEMARKNAPPAPPQPSPTAGPK